MRDVMQTQFVAATEDMDQEAVAKLVTANHLLAVPVLDAAGRMQGIVTVDDIVDVVQEEASEDIQKVGGMEALDAPISRSASGAWCESARGGSPSCSLGEMLTATAMGYFEHEIARAVVLALFVPLIISSGGNSGSQATTLVIQAMAVGEVAAAGLVEDCAPGILDGAGARVGAGNHRHDSDLLWQAIWQPYGPLSRWRLTVAFSLIGVVLFGTVAGSMLPFISAPVRAGSRQRFCPVCGDVGGCDRAGDLFHRGQHNCSGAHCCD